MLSGKGLFLYVGKHCGTPQQAVQWAVDLGLAWIAPRIAYAIYPQYNNPTYPTEQMVELVERAHAAGILVVGWHYVCGGVRINVNGQPFAFKAGYGTPEQEAELGIQQVERLNLDGYVINGEKEWKVGDQASRAQRFMKTLRKGIRVPVGVTTYRWPSLHPEFPYRVFLEECDFNMPQVYWNNTPGASRNELNRTVMEYGKLTKIPMLPIGRAYGGESGFEDPKPGDIKQFMDTCLDLHLPGCSFWSADKLRTAAYGPALVDVIKAYKWPSNGSAQPKAVVLAEWAFHLDQWARDMGYKGPRLA